MRNVKEYVDENPPETKRKRFHKNLCVSPMNGYWKYIKFNFAKTTKNRDMPSVQSGAFAYCTSPSTPEKAAVWLSTSRERCEINDMVFYGRYSLVDGRLLYITLSSEYGDEDRAWRVEDGLLKPLGQEEFFHMIGFDFMSWVPSGESEGIESNSKKARSRKPDYPTDDDLAEDWGYEDWEAFSACN